MKRFLIVLFAVSLILNALMVPSEVSGYYTNMSASIVIGQPNLISGSANQGGSAGANTLNLPTGVLVVGSRLLIAELNNNRILIYNTIPTANNASADVVIGQTNFTSTSANQGGSAGANTLSGPATLNSDGQKLFVGDRVNNRVLIFNSIPTTNNVSADVVVGQPDFATTSTGTTASKFSSGNIETGGFLDASSGKFIVTDPGNNRILIYNSIPTTNGASADVVVGQSDFTSGSANQGGAAPTASTLSSPRGAIVVNGKLITVDRLNNRVLIFNSIPTSNNASADVVIGQPDFVSTNKPSGCCGASATLLNTSSSIRSDGRRLYLLDRGDNRVLIYNSIPTSNNASADVVIGQTDFTGTTGNYTGSVSASGFSGPNTIFLSGNQLFVTDGSNNRVLIFNNTLVTPLISLTTPLTRLPGAKLRAIGNVVLGSKGTYSLQSLQVSINGTNFGNVTNLGSGLDSGNNTSYDFYSDIDPTVGDVSGSTENYTLKFLASSFNAETNYLFYFTPFTFNSFNVSNPKLQKFTFTINKNQINRIKDNIDHFEVWYRKNTTTSTWTQYISNISKTQIDPNSGVIVATKTDGIKFIGSYIFKITTIDNWSNKQDSNLLYTAGSAPFTVLSSTFTNNFNTFPSPTPFTQTIDLNQIPTPTPSENTSLIPASETGAQLPIDRQKILIIISGVLLTGGVILLITAFRRRK